MTHYLYQSTAPIHATPVKVRATGAAAKHAAEYAAAIAAKDEAKVEALASKVKAPIRFVPSPDATLRRYAVDDATLDKWMAETDSAKRAAILADIEPVETASPIAPSIAAYAKMREGLRVRGGNRPASAQLLSELASGTLIVPALARGRSANGGKSAAETTAAAAAMFDID